jgi:hypothetical protein
MLVEIVIDGPRNQNLYFRPLQKTLRGTWDVNRIPDPQGRMLASEFPRPIPGVHVVLDSEKRVAAVVETLHAPEHRAIREKIEAKGLRLGPQREEFQDVDVNTWAFWLRRAVAIGVAKIVEGKFGEIDEAKAKKNFVTVEKPDPRDNLIDRLVAVLYAGLPPERRNEVAALIGG